MFDVFVFCSCCLKPFLLFVLLFFLTQCKTTIISSIVHKFSHFSQIFSQPNVSQINFNNNFYFSFPKQTESQESSSDSPSLSSNSFISAMSSQEDITLVNLHMQVNKPIIDSPLLMASYVTHLAQVNMITSIFLIDILKLNGFGFYFIFQLRCANWSQCCLPFGADSFSTPLFQQNEDGGLVYIGSKLVPHFDTYSNWREVRIVSRMDSASTTATITQAMPRSHPWDPNVLLRGSDSVKTSDGKDFYYIITTQ